MPRAGIPILGNFFLLRQTNLLHIDASSLPIGWMPVQDPWIGLQQHVSSFCKPNLCCPFLYSLFPLLNFLPQRLGKHVKFSLPGFLECVRIKRFLHNKFPVESDYWRPASFHLATCHKWPWRGGLEPWPGDLPLLAVSATPPHSPKSAMMERLKHGQSLQLTWQTNLAESACGSAWGGSSGVWDSFMDLHRRKWHYVK